MTVRARRVDFKIQVAYCHHNYKWLILPKWQNKRLRSSKWSVANLLYPHTNIYPSRDSLYYHIEACAVQVVRSGRRVVDPLIKVDEPNLCIRYVLFDTLIAV